MNSQKIPVSLLFLLIGHSINVSVSLFFPSALTSILACVLYIGFFLLLVKNYPRQSLLLVGVFFLQVSVLVSLIAIEGGSKMPEMAAVGAPSASSAVYSLFATLTLICGVWVHFLAEDFFHKKSTADRAMVSGGGNLTFVVPVLMISFADVWLILKGLQTGFPLLSGFDRFEYRRYSADPVTLNLLNLKLVLAVLMGSAVAVVVKKSSKLLIHCLFLLYLAISFLFADKFFIVVMAAMFYICSQILLLGDSISDRLGMLARWLLMLLIPPSMITYFIYSGQGALDFQATMERLLDRFSGQGQLWYLQFSQDFSWVRFDWDLVLKNLESVFSTNAQDFVFANKLSAFYFLDQFAPDFMYFSFLRNGGWVTPTMVLEPYSLALFGLWGSLASFLVLGFAVGLLSYFLKSAVLSRNPLKTLCWSFALLQLQSMIVSGTLSSMFSVATFKTFFAFWVFYKFLSMVSKDSVAVGAPLRA